MHRITRKQREANQKANRMEHRKKNVQIRVKNKTGEPGWDCDKVPESIITGGHWI